MNQKKVILTGASGGIGSALAKAFANAGCSLALLGNRSTEKLDTLTELCRQTACPDTGSIFSLTGDISQINSAQSLMEEAVTRLGGVDLLINCAGISYIGLLSDMPPAEWERILNTNLSSVFYCCRSIVPHMVRRQTGKILNISSVWGSHGASCEVAYSATKGAVNTFTKALARELAPSGIAVNALACGMIDTPMNQCFSPEEIKDICDEIPAGRMGTPEEVAETALLLAKAPVYLTGQIVTIDGGWC